MSAFLASLQPRSLWIALALLLACYGGIAVLLSLDRWIDAWSKRMEKKR